MAEASYKKRDGILTLSKDNKIVSWAPKSPPKAPPELTILIADITNLQQTPPTNAKVMMKVFAQSARAVEPLVYVFTFTSATQARAQSDTLKESLSAAIQAAKSASNGVSVNGGPEERRSGNADKNAPLHTDEILLGSHELQQDLLRQNAALNRTFLEAGKTKPEGITVSQFNKQFWSSRLGLLRAHAIERTQKTGEYNVLSTIKLRMEDNEVRVSLPGDQQTLLLRQYPVVRKAFDENVPKIEISAFWMRFFKSRLFKKLKGERIVDTDPRDNVLDKYLAEEDNARLQKRMQEAHIPHTMDLLGNEVNHSQQKGNAPDRSMRPQQIDKVPIIRTLNSMSERLMSQVAPSDIDPSQPIGVDEATYNELALRDLQGDEAENRLILNVKDQGRFFASGKDAQAGLDLLTSTNTTPAQLLKRLQNSLATDNQGLSTHDLTQSLGLDEDSDVDSEDDSTAQSQHFSSHRALGAASKQIFDLVSEQRLQSEDTNTSSTLSTNTPLSLILPKSGLSTEILDRLALTHAATIEFLHYFWSTFLSGDPARAEEIASLTVTLDRAKQRIEAVAMDAEAERVVQIKKLKQTAQERAKRMGKQALAIDENAVKGGKKAVNRLMEPTIASIDVALGKYQEAKFEAEMENGA